MDGKQSALVRLHQNAIAAFNRVFEVLHHGGKIPCISEQNRLIIMERTLTHETFARFPVLWKMCFAANWRLIHEIHEPLHTLASPDFTEPAASLAQSREMFEEEWIVLDDAAEILSGCDPRYVTWGRLKEQKRRVMKVMETLDEIFEARERGLGQDVQFALWERLVSLSRGES
jgi:hypothetical protein